MKTNFKRIIKSRRIQS